MTQTATVLGGGSFGTCIATLLADAGNDVRLWLRDPAAADEINTRHTNERYFKGATLPERVRATTQLEEACKHSTLVFAVIPSKVFRQVMADAAPSLTAEHMVVHGTKGLERETFKPMSALIREETCVRRIGAVAGPNLAQEIIERKPAATVVGSRFDEVVRRVREAMTTKDFLVYGNKDLLGVELGGTLKNVLAIGAGIVDGADLGANTKSMLITRGLAEMIRFAVHMGADARTSLGLSGIGDIMATCTSPLSRNYQVGLRLGRGETLAQIRASMTQVAEGVDTISVLNAYAEKHDIRITLTRGLHHLLFKGASIAEVRKMVMQASSLYESESF
jgi:glycerol-3-phosphate dehydrogenase (NAD(P)+)